MQSNLIGGTIHQSDNLELRLPWPCAVTEVCLSAIVNSIWISWQLLKSVISELPFQHPSTNYSARRQILKRSLFLLESPYTLPPREGGMKLGLTKLAVQRTRIMIEQWYLYQSLVNRWQVLSEDVTTLKIQPNKCCFSFFPKNSFF